MRVQERRQTKMRADKQAFSDIQIKNHLRLKQALRREFPYDKRVRGIRDLNCAIEAVLRQNYSTMPPVQVSNSCSV